MKYNILLRIDVGDAIDSVGDLMRDLNAGLATFGLSEQIALTSDMSLGTLECDRALTTPEESQVREIIQTQIGKLDFLSQWSPVVTIAKSCSQSRSNSR